MHVMQFVEAESDVDAFKLPATGKSVLSYEIVPPGDSPLDKEFRLGSQRSMASIITSLEEMLARACTGMMTNLTLLHALKVSHELSLHLANHQICGRQRLTRSDR